MRRWAAALVAPLPRVPVERLGIVTTIRVAVVVEPTNPRTDHRYDVSLVRCASIKCVVGRRVEVCHHYSVNVFRLLEIERLTHRFFAC